jgi:hypothetical protein
MEYTIHHSCGHQGTIHVVNPRCLSRKDNQSIAMAEKRICHSCYQVACQDQAKERFGKLPEFSGSEAQQEFAKSVFQQLLAGMASNDPMVLGILAQDILDPCPLLDAWNGSPHRNVVPTKNWQWMILRGAYGSLLPKEVWSEVAKSDQAAMEALREARGLKLVPVSH